MPIRNDLTPEQRYRLLASRSYQLHKTAIQRQDAFELGLYRRIESMRALAQRLTYTGGYVPDLPHPYQTSTGATCCEVCGGHYDRLMHQPPWLKPIYRPCAFCVDHEDVDCDVCGNTRLSYARSGVVEVRPKQQPRHSRRPYSGRKWKRRKGRWRTLDRLRPGTRAERRAAKHSAWPLVIEADDE